jgi:hypothetical protein
MIHLKVGETKLTDMLRQIGFNGGTAGDQNHLVAGQSPANFKAAKKMADSQNMLAVLDYFHISGKVDMAAKSTKTNFQVFPLSQIDFTLG